MIIYLIGKNEMHKVHLSQKVEGNFWVTDEKNNYKILNIFEEDGNWCIKGDENIKILDKKYLNVTTNGIKIDNLNNELKMIKLKEYEDYAIYIKELNQVFMLFCFPYYEEKLFQLNVYDNEISIGNNKNSDIFYNEPLVADIHARLLRTKTGWTIENYDNNFGTFVNNTAITEETSLFNGDVIFILGLYIVILGNSIFINNPENKIICNSKKFKLNKEKIELKNDDKPEVYNEQYSQEEYFSRIPRITNKIECERVKIDPPPAIKDQDEMPLILTLGSSLSMGAMMVISIVSAIDGRISGTASSKQTIFSVLTALVMLVSMLLFPILISKYTRKKNERYEENRQKKYKEYLNAKSNAINKIMNKQRNILFENFVSTEECAKIMINKSTRLWERKIEDNDFLEVRVGTGDVPLKIEVQYPEQRFEMNDDCLIDILHSITDNSKILKSAPVTISFLEKNISAIISRNDEIIDKFMQSIIIQLIAMHSYEDLKLVFLMEDEKKWDYIKFIPHLWDNSEKIRFFSDDYNEMQEISAFLEDELKSRIETEKEEKVSKKFTPYYMIITDNYKKIEKLRIITEMLNLDENKGFGLLCVANNMNQLPNECETFINIENEENGVIFDNEISSDNQRKFILDNLAFYNFEKITSSIANLPISMGSAKDNLLPNNYSFLEMFNAGSIEQLNILNRWDKNDATLSLRTPIGVDSAGRYIYLDIHEKFHGPHGLIAGSTGSGKSEFIITYILSLAVNYHPDDVNFILIDYKGGGVAGAFQKADYKLPHLVGTITNIEVDELQRSLASIQSELKRRQVIFNEARNITDEGTIDIYKYQRLYHQGIVKEPIPHLLIICDEFAELKQQQPDFMDELISVSRIGRSLGVQLILATQKPAGVVNEQIRSNSKFAICLKVQSKEDSKDVIGKNDAAYLKKTGQFYMQVGNDEYFVLGQAAWSGALYIPSNTVEKKMDNSIEFISNIGTTIKQINEIQPKNVANQGEQLTNIVKYLSNLAQKSGIKERNLWLQNIPHNIYLNEVKNKYNIVHKSNIIDPVIGEYDDPYHQRQGIVSMNLTQRGNTLIYGNAESGKETLLSTMIYDLISTYTTDEVCLYLLDFGSEALKIYRNSPHVGDIVFSSDEEKIDRFFIMLKNIINERKEVLSNYNGDYNSYIKNSKKPMPMIVVVINSYEAYAEIYDSKYDEIFLNLTREGVRCGVCFVLTISNRNDIRYRLAQNFKQKIVLQLNDDNDYYMIFEGARKKKFAQTFGRGLICADNGDIYEFQTAKIAEGSQYSEIIADTIEKTRKQNPAKPIPVLPEKVKLVDINEKLKDLTYVPIGIEKKDLKVVGFNFKKNFINIITGNNIEDIAFFTACILKEILHLEKTRFVILDAEKIIFQKDKDLIFEYQKLIEDVNTDEENDIVCMIIGIDKFISHYEAMGNNFYKSLRELNTKCNFIFAETVDKFEKYKYKEWYEQYLKNDTAIWVGDGIIDQRFIRINFGKKEAINNCGKAYGYLIKKDKISLIKLLGMEEYDDEDE